MKSNALVLILSCLLSLSASGQFSENVDLISNWSDPAIDPEGSHSQYNEVWGFEWDKRLYAVIGSREGTYIIEVTDPRRPKQIQFIAGAHDFAINRDYHDHDGYLYMVCDQGLSTFQIADMRSLPDSLTLIYDSDEYFSRCHNIFIDSTSNRLYACNVTKADSVEFGLVIFDLTEPAEPKWIFDTAFTDFGFHDIYVRNGIAYGNNEYFGLQVYDLTDLNDVRVLASLPEYPHKGLNHSGWLSEDGAYYYFIDETHGTDVKVLHVEDLGNITVVDLFNSGTQPTKTIAHNIIVRDTLLYISYYHDGLQVYSLKDPANPKKVGYYKTYTKNDYDGAKGAWGVYPFLRSGYVLLSDRERGLFVFGVDGVTGARRPELGGVYPNPFTDYLRLNIFADRLTRIDLYNLNGSLVEENVPFQNEYGETLIRFRQDHSGGTYLLKTLGVDQEQTHKVIKLNQ